MRTAKGFYEAYLGEELPKEKFLIEPDDLILLMTEYAKEYLDNWYQNISQMAYEMSRKKC